MDIKTCIQTEEDMLRHALTVYKTEYNYMDKRFYVGGKPLPTATHDEQDRFGYLSGLVSAIEDTLAIYKSIRTNTSSLDSELKHIDDKLKYAYKQRSIAHDRRIEKRIYTFETQETNIHGFVFSDEAYFTARCEIFSHAKMIIEWLLQSNNIA